MSKFQCSDGDYEGGISGAIHHCDITGHALTRSNNFGTTTIVRDDWDRSVFREDDDAED